MFSKIILFVAYAATIPIWTFWYTIDSVKAHKVIGLNKELLEAVKNGKLEEVKRLHLSGVDICDWDNAALIWSAKYGHLEVVKYLAENGADIHAADDDALRWSAKSGHSHVVKYLIENGADVSKINIGNVFV